MGINIKGLHKVKQSFGVIFIIFILAANTLLLAKQCRKPGFYFSPKNMIIISLAVGDIIFALFPLVVNAKLLFDFHLRVANGCSVIIAADAYANYLIQFVYGVGLLVIGADIIFRYNLQHCLNRYKLLASILASCTPWIFGLLIVLPLCLTMDNSRSCMTLHSIETKTSVSVFLPASLALISSIAILFFNWEGYNDSDNIETAAVNLQNISASASGEALSRDAIPLRQLNHDQHQNPIDCEQRSPLVTEPSQPLKHRVNLQQSHYPESERLNFVCYSQSNLTKEKIRLVVIAFVYVLMVLPFSIHEIYVHKEWIIDPDVRKMVKEVVTWLIIARSFVTPVILTFFRVRDH
ncbi:uncharacterized protein LOC129927022 [Biomphalaria glabrata]|uniref:Uncharacterized protein LOC129927022 n=1 Tax=Biomphalaria glabrata TaxID=6526 RepID=A0A9W3ASF0_BIOGL|nr:uncharacterized protein LOC129927022 [Biomphalaria glabrata]